MNRRNQIVAGVVLLIASTLVFMFLYISSPSMTPVFSSLSDSQRTLVKNFLSSESISFDERDGVILVDESMARQVRFLVFERNILREDSVGFELFSESDYGMSEFTQKVNYQRAMQGEFEKTISSISGVDYARVHLKIPDKKILFGKERQATASVILHLKPGYQLTEEQITGIQMLISGGVDKLSQQDVHLIDQYGKVLNEYGSSIRNSGLKGQSSYQEMLKSKAEMLLKQWFTDEEFAISVIVEINNDKRSKKIEGFIQTDNPIVKRKKNTFEIEDKNSRKKSIPKESEAEFIYGKEVESIEYAGGVIDNISVGIVLTPLKQTSVTSEQITSLLSSGLGIDEDRGDKLVLVLDSSKIDAYIKTEAKVSPDRLELAQPRIDESRKIPDSSNLTRKVQVVTNYLDKYWLYCLAVFVALLVAQLVVIQLRRRSNNRKLEKIVEWIES